MNNQKLVKDGVVPEDFIYASSGYMAECEDAMPMVKRVRKEYESL